MEQELEAERFINLFIKAGATVLDYVWVMAGAALVIFTSLMMMLVALCIIGFGISAQVFRVLVKGR
ncbi:MAG: hypothetical protein ACREBU_20275 [Nitrososphaera sp.]